jgi:glycosyltransferase involved in cell wall biosynthesis
MNPPPVRVLFPFVGDSVGGSHRSAALLIGALDRARFEPVVLLHRDGPLQDLLGKAGIPFVRAHDLPLYDPAPGRAAAALGLLEAVPYLAGFLRHERIGIVHAHDARMSVTWALPARLAGRKFILHQRTRFISSRLTTLAARLAHRIVAISNYNAGTLPLAFKSRATVVANPFDTVALSPDRPAARAAILAAAGLPGDRAIVSFVGTLQEQKRPFVFVEAAAEIARQAKLPVAFLMFGRDAEGLAEEIGQRAEALGIGGALRWLDFRPDIETALAASDLVLAPAVNEGFGRVLVEAALAGTPVVAADSGGHREIVANGEDGVLVPADDPKAMAQAALGLLADPELSRRLAAAAGERARSRYSPQTHARRIAAVYDEVLGRRRADAALVIESLGGGGAQHVLAALANRWAMGGRNIAVVTLQGPESDVFRLDPEIRRIAIGGAERSCGLLAALRANLARLCALRRALRDTGAPVAVAFVGGTNVLLVLAALGLPVRTVISERNDPERQRLPGSWNLLRRFVYPLADLVTANSEAAVKTLSRFVPRRKLAFVPNPLRTADGAETAAKAGPAVVAAGRLHPQKGFDVLLEAFAKVRRNNPDWRLVILGEGALEEPLKAQAKSLGIEEVVDWMGFVADPFPWYRAADIFALPSRHEGTPNALLEAMSCGAPAVVSDAVAGELVADGVSGLVVRAGDAAALAEALEKLMRDASLRKSLGEAGCARIAAQSPDDALAAWEKIVFAGA